MFACRSALITCVGRGLPRLAAAILARRSGSRALAHIALRAFRITGRLPLADLRSKSPSFHRGTPSALRHFRTSHGVTPHQKQTAQAASRWTARTKEPVSTGDLPNGT